MKIDPFDIEHYFARYEFTTPFLLCASDCETISVNELLTMAGRTEADLGALKLGYTESQGDPVLRSAVAGTYSAVALDHVVILGSPEEGIYLAMRALLEPGDHVVVLTPAYDSLLNLARHVSGNVSRWEIRPAEGRWELDLDQLISLVSSRTKLIVVNFPHNPTGFLPDLDQFRSIIEIARQHKAWIFCDEMYRGLELNGLETLPSMADLYERCLVLAGLSKVYGLPGLRAGWLVIRDEVLRAEVMNWKFYTSICPPAPTEYLALAALQTREQLIERNRGLIEQNIGDAGAFFGRWPDLFTWRPPQASSVALVGLHRPSATDYCHHLAEEAGVLLLPSSCLGYGDGHVRMGFGRESFGKGLARYETYLQSEENQRRESLSLT
ncbi:MAG: aminotransferase class I/II-fold pyridoxal phosphate-dependent enzyme [Chloroflexi bacterium]|jgi:aspartate/methionine/tyrosine aminotransferase|nr:aminotransferase class I/II-fold pyridoxal phosphate-dependent enzyme [Chloroflexota bacterium]